MHPAMTEVLFYHLQSQPLERALPALLERCLERGWRAVVEAGSPERRDAIDGMLWTYREDSFLPHGTPAEGTPETQPILVTAEAHNPNKASVRFLVDGAAPTDVDSYVRIVLLFDGNDADDVAAARVHWQTLKAAGHDLSYWQQDGNGRWSRKA
jgi:DNA polymerase-3 subunit chi